MSVSIWQVALLSPPFASLSYSLPDYLPSHLWQRGLRVLIPLGRTLRLGILLGPDSNAGTDLIYKNIIWPVEKQALLDSAYMDLLQELAVRQMSSIGQVAASILPQTFKLSSLSFAIIGEKVLSAKNLSQQPATRLQHLGQLWIQDQMNIRPRSLDPEQLYTVAQDPPWPLRPAAKRQLELMEYLWDKGAVSRQVLQRDLGPWALRSLTILENKQLIAKTQEEDPVDFCSDTILPVESTMTLTSEQQDVLKAFKSKQEQAQEKIFLLHGVTGSGKTLVYLEMIRHCLQKGENVLLLAPEVAIALHLYARAQKYLGLENIFLFHGYQPGGQREKMFLRSSQQSPICVIGTRSALFLPISDPGLIILDEEHDESFKQDERLIYQAKEIAWFRTVRKKGVLVLGSATPDIKSFYAAQQEQIKLLNMRQRVGSRTLPQIEIIDLKQNPPIGYGPFSPPCREALEQALGRGEQVIIMHNRRGYAPLLYCEQCNEAVKCPHCQIGLTYHKNRQRLVCHYCGLSRPFPLACDNCGSFAYTPVGEGTEKLEEYLQRTLGGQIKILRLDRDSTRRKGRMEQILNDFSQGKAQILVGTQMLSKGHDFPEVTLVIVIDGDLGLNMPDYRGTERTFQLLVQVAGRAGRGDKPGQVMIQTRNPDHYCWQFVRENNYIGFYEQEIDLRRRFAYPPFVKLGLIRLSFPAEQEQGAQLIQRFRRAIHELDLPSLRILGPAPAPISVLRGRFRHQCLIKSQDWPSIRQVYARVKREFNKEKEIRLSFDPDPMNML